MNPIKIRIVNQSKHVTLNNDIRTEIEEQVAELGDKFSGPVIIRDVPEKEGKTTEDQWELIQSCS